MLMNRFNRRFAAEAATRRRKNVASQLFKIHFDRRPEKNVEDVLTICRFTLLAMNDLYDVASLAKQSFR